VETSLFDLFRGEPFIFSSNARLADDIKEIAVLGSESARSAPSALANPTQTRI